MTTMATMRAFATDTCLITCLLTAMTRSCLRIKDSKVSSALKLFGREDSPTIEVEGPCAARGGN